MVRSHDDGESILTRTMYWNEMRMQLWLQFHRKALHSSDLARNEVERYTHTHTGYLPFGKRDDTTYCAINSLRSCFSTRQLALTHLHAVPTYSVAFSFCRFNHTSCMTLCISMIIEYNLLSH